MYNKDIYKSWRFMWAFTPVVIRSEGSRVGQAVVTPLPEICNRDRLK